MDTVNLDVFPKMPKKMPQASSFHYKKIYKDVLPQCTDDTLRTYLLNSYHVPGPGYPSMD